MASPSHPIVAAPWRKTFQEHLSKMASREMSLATIAHNAQGQWAPRVRYVGFRAFWGEIELRPETEKQLKDANELNPRIFESDLLTFTTDIRMEKAGELAASGNVVEAAFWAKETKNQWRIRGRAFVIGAEENEKVEVEAREEIRKGMRLKDGKAEEGEWSWEKEVTTLFANHTPVLRGEYTMSFFLSCGFCVRFFYVVIVLLLCGCGFYMWFIFVALFTMRFFDTISIVLIRSAIFSSFSYSNWQNFRFFQESTTWSSCY